MGPGEPLTWQEKRASFQGPGERSLKVEAFDELNSVDELGLSIPNFKFDREIRAEIAIVWPMDAYSEFRLGEKMLRVTAEAKFASFECLCGWEEHHCSGESAP